MAPAHPNHGDAFSIAISRRMDRLHPAREVATSGCLVIRFDFHWTQRRQLAIEVACAVFRCKPPVVIAQDEGQLRVIAHIHVRLLENPASTWQTRRFAVSSL